MAITTLLAAASGAANSADVAVSDGSSVTLTATGQGTIAIQPKTVSGYSNGETFGGAGVRTVQLSGPLTFRAVRPADSAAGVSMEAA